MKTKLTETKFKSALGRAGQLFSRVVCLGAAILICSSASAQNMFVSGTDPRGGEIFKFSWDGKQSIFASKLHYPGIWQLIARATCLSSTASAANSSATRSSIK